MDSNASFEDLCSNPAFAMLMDNLGAGVVVYSADGGILFANSVMVNWRNIPRQEYMKRNVHDFIRILTYVCLIWPVSRSGR